MVNAILPLFSRSKFTVERDRKIVRDLLVSELMHTLPGKKEYIQYVGEWKTVSWTEKELDAAFTSELKWDQLEFAAGKTSLNSFRPFEPKVPSALQEAVKNGYRLDTMPAQNQMTWATLLSTPSGGLGNLGKGITQAVLIVGSIAAGGLVLILVLMFLLVRWIFY